MESAQEAQKAPWSVRVGEFTAPSGQGSFYERFEREVTLSTLKTSPIVGEACEACDGYGRNYGCPPHSPALEEYTQESEKALVIAYRLPLEPFEETIPEERYQSCFDAGRELLFKELARWQEEGCKVGGSGPCNVCAKCSKLSEELTCRLPAKRLYSLEAMGVNVVELLKDAFKIELEWLGDAATTGSITAVGAVFL